jgi:hypothetical protein
VEAAHTAEEPTTSASPRLGHFISAHKFRPHMGPRSGCIRLGVCVWGGGGGGLSLVCPSLLAEQPGVLQKKAGGEVTERARQKARAGTAAGAAWPGYQRRAGLRFSRSCNPALTAAFFFHKQDASI